MTPRLSQALKIFISFNINSFHLAAASASGYLGYNSGKENVPKSACSWDILGLWRLARRALWDPGAVIGLDRYPALWYCGVLKRVR